MEKQVNDFALLLASLSSSLSRSPEATVLPSEYIATNGTKESFDAALDKLFPKGIHLIVVKTHKNAL